jgi:hypothetical protein
MKVGQLKKLLAKVPDDTMVVTDSHDHSYRRVDVAEKVKAEKCAGKFNEYYGKDQIFENGVVVDVFRIN